jgi:LDH2 family malate/lactate/ureidoglycolate dehydrogenase
VVLPGEPERAARAKRTREGITIDDATWLEIVGSCKKVGAQT